MNAVAMMTPDPKYFAMKKAHSGTWTPLWRPAKTGKTAPDDGCQHRVQDMCGA